MKIVWKNLFNDLNDIEKDFLDEKDNIINQLDKKDKCYTIMNKFFDICKNKDINIQQDNKIYNLIKNRKKIAYIKKMKNKLQINFSEINFTCVLSPKDNYERTLDTICILLEK